jgi:methylmalonyl-CoA mutase C-terminal domain/subunit
MPFPEDQRDKFASKATLDGTVPRPRVLLTKSFIDSHARAIGTIALALRDASMEVIWFEYEVPEQISGAAIQEDVDVIGVSFMSGGQVEVTQELMKQLRQEGRDDIAVIVGGTIRPFDVAALEEAGVRRIFRGGESLNSVVDAFSGLASERRGWTTTQSSGTPDE